MIQKIKSLFEIEGKISEINSKINDSNAKISELNGNFSEFKKNFSEIKVSQDELLKNLKDNIDTIRILREDFEKELYEFNLMKSQTQKKILDKFEQELQKDLELGREALKKDVEDYGELRKRMGDMALKLNSANDGILKFIEISRSIRKEDFELTKFARQLFDADREKLEMMRKIDTLERLVSKLRRG